MQHSLANSLLQENTPYPIITGILGHENSNTTQRYLAIDTEQLRKVALEVICTDRPSLLYYFDGFHQKNYPPYFCVDNNSRIS